MPILPQVLVTNSNGRTKEWSSQIQKNKKTMCERFRVTMAAATR